MDEIRLAVMYIYNVDPCNLSRKRQYAEARQAFCYYARRYTNYSLRAIGQYIGVTHSAVIHDASTYYSLLRYRAIYKKAMEIDSRLSYLESL